MTAAAAISAVQVIGKGADGEPAVSVIMIFFNARKYLGAAIESVITQSFQSWELVLVDDGSTDDSRELAMNYAEKYPGRIRLFEHPDRRNQGTGPSRNLGMAMARGRYLAFLDADDIYEPDRLEHTVPLLESDPTLGVVINRELYWRSWQPAKETARNLLRLPDQVIGPGAERGRVIPPPVLITSTLATPGAPMPAICSITFRKQDVVDLGGVPASFASQYEDQALIAKLLLNRSAIVIGDCLARYRQHAESLTHQAMAQGEYRPGRPHAARRQFISWLLEYARECGVNEPLLTRALAGELEPPRRNPVARLLNSTQRLFRRALLLGANGLLPRQTVDGLAGWYLARQGAKTGRRMAKRAAEMEGGQHRGNLPGGGPE